MIFHQRSWSVAMFINSQPLATFQHMEKNFPLDNPLNCSYVIFRVGLGTLLELTLGIALEST